MSRQTFPDSLIFSNAAPEIDAPNATVYARGYESGKGKTPPKAGVHNALFNRSDLQHQHVERNGMPKYDARTPYDHFGLTIATNGGIYQSKTQGNTNHDPVSSPSQWDFVISPQKTRDIDAAIAANTQLTKDNQARINQVSDVANKNKADIAQINSRINALFVEFMKDLFPVKSAVMRPVNPGSPVSSGGLGFGTWQEKPGRVPIGAGSYSDGTNSKSFNENSDYGKFMHRLSIDEMPSHSHGQHLPVDYGGSQDLQSLVGSANADEQFIPMENTTSVGGGQPHNNIQPCFGVRIWYRVA